ncbi:penicillin-binding transpeptidase domain-containing protein [Nocardioides sp. CPCC 205120]|uniref:penicillin-binding transpeptidase domain-containing protein n=1 Tax=Nocardioides sp. CPCC 205120 TaxID=3406462 RepID=UPI003B50F783
MGQWFRRGGAATVVALVASASLVACSGDDEEREAATEVVTSLAAALSAGELDDVPLSGARPAEAQEQHDAIVAGMGEAEPVVSGSAVEVYPDNGRATAQLAWSWELGSATWDYTTTVELTGAGEDWSVRWSPALVESSLLEGEVLRARTVAAPRGAVLAGDGTPIVVPRPVLRYGIDKSLTDAATAATSAQALAEALGIDAAAFVQRVAAAGPRAFVEALVVRVEQADPNLLAGTPGVAALEGTRQLAPTRTFAAPVLGTVGEATAEIVEESDGAVAAGDVVGLSGLQRRYDDTLRGTDGIGVVVVDAEGGEREVHAQEPVPGTDLTTSLDVPLQTLAESALAEVGPASALVAVRPSDGALLAVANGPGTGGTNIATSGQFAPGSTFKVVSALALLRAGVAPDDAVECPATTTVDGRTFENYDDYPAAALGRITLTRAVANSCNTAFLGSADLLGEGALAEAAAALGLGVDHDLGFPAYLGSVPAPESATEAAASLIGQGRVQASPMAMATVAASVAAGRAVLPRLLPEVPTEQVPPASPLTPEEAAALQGFLRAVVTEGSGRALADLPGAPVGAKTGTAEFGTTTPPATHAWMIATQGDLAVAVFVETGESGSRTAGPVLRAFLAGAAG